jgi:hypothetical protein
MRHILISKQNMFDMASTEEQFKWDVLSTKSDSLKNLIDCKIINLAKASYETFADHLEYLDLTSQASYRDKLSFFKYSYGSLLIVFDNGIEYSFASAEDLNSVIMCCQKGTDGKRNSNYIMDDKDVLDIASISDFESEFGEMLNQKVMTINILTAVDLNSKQRALPSEQGIEFIFENGSKLILSHNLTENSFVFAVLSQLDKITPKSIVKMSFQ